MKTIKFTPEFKRNFRKRISKDSHLVKLFHSAVENFPENREELKDHALTGKMQKYRAFSVDIDCRIVYIEAEESYIFIDIGTHDEVYIR